MEEAKSKKKINSSEFLSLEEIKFMIILYHNQHEPLIYRNRNISIIDYFKSQTIDSLLNKNLIKKIEENDNNMFNLYIFTRFGNKLIDEIKLDDKIDFEKTYKEFFLEFKNQSLKVESMHKKLRNKLLEANQNERKNNFTSRKKK